MKKEPYIFCPMTKMSCTKECAWYCDGKCAMQELSKRMFYVANGINDLLWAIKEKSDLY